MVRMHSDWIVNFSMSSDVSNLQKKTKGHSREGEEGKFLIEAFDRQCVNRLFRKAAKPLHFEW